MKRPRPLSLFVLVLPLVAVWVGLGTVGCGDDAPPAGTEWGPCFSNGTCNPGLTCTANKCVDLGPCTDGEVGPCTCPEGGAGVRQCTAGNWGICGCTDTCGDGTCDAEESYSTCPQDCVSFCGNGVLEGDEYCDGTAHADLDCTDFGHGGGSLACGASCQADVTGCFDCGNGLCEAGERPSSCAQDCPANPPVDVLFVVDNSGSMADEQVMLQAQFPAFLSGLSSGGVDLPDLHLGVTSTDLGTSPFPITFCEQAGGDGGHLLTGACSNPVGAPYLLDVAPQGCTIDRAGGSCTSHDCLQANCLEGTITEDASSGCPRCRNYEGETLDEAFSCIAGLGIQGCGFEQQLEAMRLALGPESSHNAGFVREGSLLVVVFLTDEDDCSASDTQLYDNSQIDINSALGPLTSFRCFEFGITCDVDSRTATGERTSCAPRDDAGALLHPMSRYLSFLEDLREPGRVIVSAIAGPVEDYSVTVGRDEYDQPEVKFSCSTERGGAVPGIRLQSFVEQLHGTAALPVAYSAICAPSFTPALDALAQQIRERM